ncbi:MULTISPECIES: hypothetical protein [unclassified Leucobacter]|uniref:hypothetical protein n=1 Tax=unclassified Leucobacter TaxID=2621730 RepID=UPI00165EBB58|nr:MULTISPECIES: hypothetical protein [unclassified Leucobacter]MBC9936571.1 hypothetical protein [Leucobacter sp. cx-87]
MTAQAFQAVQTLDKCSDEIAKLTGAVNSALQLVPAFLRDLLGDVYKKWNEFCDVAQAFFDRCAEVFGYGLGDPGALRELAETWSTKTVELLEESSKVVSAAQLRADSTWVGPSATQYAQAISDQSEAIAQVKSSAKLMGRALEDHAGAIDNFWGNIINGFVNFLLSLAGAVVSALALVPPLTPLGIIGLIISVIGAVKSVWDLFATEISDLEQFAEDAKRLAEDVHESLADPWPVLVK